MSYNNFNSFSISHTKDVNDSLKNLFIQNLDSCKFENNSDLNMIQLDNEASEFALPLNERCVQEVIDGLYFDDDVIEKTSIFDKYLNADEASAMYTTPFQYNNTSATNSQAFYNSNEYTTEYHHSFSFPNHMTGSSVSHCIPCLDITVKPKVQQKNESVKDIPPKNYHDSMTNIPLNFNESEYHWAPYDSNRDYTALNHYPYKSDNIYGNNVNGSFEPNYLKDNCDYHDNHKLISSNKQSVQSQLIIKEDLSKDQRKKELNKARAKRYRERQRQNVTQTKNEIHQLEEKNSYLVSKHSQLQKEKLKIMEYLINKKLIPDNMKNLTCPGLSMKH